MVTNVPAWVVIAVVVSGGAAIATGWLMDTDRPDPSVPVQSQPQSHLTPLAPAPALPSPVDNPVVTATPRALSVVLSGVAVGSDLRPLALVSIDRGPELLLRVGDSMGGSARVLRIDPDSLTYLDAGAEIRVSVKSAPAASAGATVATSAKPLAGFVAAAPAIARAEGTQPGSGNAVFRQTVERKRMAIAAGQ